MRHMVNHPLRWTSVALLSVACTTKPPPAEPPPPAPPATSEPAPTAKPTATADDPPPTTPPGMTADAAAPFVLALSEATAVTGAQLEYDVTATLSASQPQAYGVTLTVKLPAGGKLLKGTLTETVKPLPAGATTRTFRFKLPKALDAADPIRVSADMKLPDGTPGAHAERIQPPPAKKASTTKKVPPPPVGRPTKGLPAKQAPPKPGN